MAESTHALDHDGYCDRVAEEITRFAGTLGRLDAGTPVPSCPDWTAKDLATHLGMIHRWVDRTVADQSPDPLEFTQFGRDLPEDWSDYGAWVAAMAEPLSRTLREADLDGPAWSFTDDRTAGFWPRRMVHETTVHRVDAELAAGDRPRVDPEVAVDGIDELLHLLHHGHPFRDQPADLRGNGETIHLHATDVDVHWLITLAPTGHGWEHLGADPERPASATVRGPAGDLHLLQYNRLLDHGDALDRTGDRDVLADWLRRSAL
ncbi:maleylpyruvate isomerase family mycothiol-dependent enzyme [Actinosynnema sp. NPDC023658]|uniref:maleylpyruvate isomerase family mycothiol-dependent enzyme n=1 Tax=Actinosynnema sp. NPDC023658 TaxID=3155465 RepID=UPI00340CE2D8